MLRTLLAPNASAMTLDGTRTYLVGRQQVAILDPGPDDPHHLDRIAREVGSARAVIILTHRHADHAGGSAALARRLRADVRSAADDTLSDGDAIATDAGALRAVATPGHTPDHVALHWPTRSAIFVGDLMMGGLDTALVAPPEGSLHDYLASLDRLAALAPTVLYPAHGPEFTEAAAAFGRYRAHRLERLAQVQSALVRAVYGDALAPELRDWALAALDAYLDYLGVEAA